MTAPMLDLNDFILFAQVDDRGGFTAASRTLRIPKSTLGHRIQQFEGDLAGTGAVGSSLPRSSGGRVCESSPDLGRRCMPGSGSASTRSIPSLTASRNPSRSDMSDKQ